jgi:hypothetical protein
MFRAPEYPEDRGGSLFLKAGTHLPYCFKLTWWDQGFTSTTTTMMVVVMWVAGTNRLMCGCIA